MKICLTLTFLLVALTEALHRPSTVEDCCGAFSDACSVSDEFTLVIFCSCDKGTQARALEQVRSVAMANGASPEEADEVCECLKTTNFAHVDPEPDPDRYRPALKECCDKFAALCSLSTPTAAIIADHCEAGTQKKSLNNLKTTAMNLGATNKEASDLVKCFEDAGYGKLFGGRKDRKKRALLRKK